MSIPIRSRAFTLIELLVVVVIIAVLAAVLLPALSAARKRALRRSLEPAPASSALPAETVLPLPGPRPRARVRSFTATVALRPELSIGTAEPESIYTARLTSRLVASNPAGDGNGGCEVLLPLPPQIISLADLEVTVDSQPSASVEIRGDKLVWFGSLPAAPTPMTIACTAVGKGLYLVQTPPGGILDLFRLDLTAVGSDVRMLDLSLQPTQYVRGDGQTVYTWAYTNLLFGRPIALDVLGIAPIDRLGELSWLGPSSVVLFGLLLGLVSYAYRIQNFDRWLLLLVLGLFAGAYPLMYFAQEFVPLKAAVPLSSALVLAVIAVRTGTIMGLRLALLGTLLPAALLLTITLLAALQTRLQGLLITTVAMALFTVAMVLLPRRKREKPSPPMVPQASMA